MYPIRISRPIWCQSFLKPHTCSEMCNTQYEITDNVIRITYQTGCLFPDKIEPVFVHISNHEIGKIDYIDAELQVPRQLTFLIDFPLRVIAKQQNTFDEGPITLRKILEVFDSMYKFIYKEEEEKASSREFQLDEKCPDCDEEKYSEEYIDHHFEAMESLESDDSQQCNICFESGQMVKLKLCQHYFHRECILKWFNTLKISDGEQEQQKSNSCPMCRQPIIHCQTCKSTCMIKIPFFGVVPPYNADSDEDRVETDGPFRIHSLYYEELYFKGVVYNRENNTIQLLPFERLEQPESTTEITEPTQV